MDNKHYLLGTAGHVDHGKTELIRALTGIETDRLKEEKQRGISIELGFAHMTLPDGSLVGIVDVPGHERFVRQMLAGASGMDMVLFVVAADEGMMPQSREHLDIITLLGIETGIVVITKSDLVDQEWLDLITEEIKEEIKDSILESSPIVHVSSKTGQGVAELKEQIARSLAQAQLKKTVGPVYMPVDRVFSVQGFGTVVTGTLHRGSLELGQDVEIAPQGLLAKVRSIQVHGQKVSKAQSGQRTAVNLSGIEVNEIARGSALMSPGALPIGQIVDVKLKHLDSTSKPIVQRQRIRFHLGTAEILGRVHLLEAEELPAGKETFAQIILEEPVAAALGDKFVIRFYSPEYTIGGGKVLGIAARKYKRFKREVIEDLQRKEKGDPSELLLNSLHDPLTLSEVVQNLKLERDDLKDLLQALIDQGLVEQYSGDGEMVYWTKAGYQEWHDRVLEQLRSYEQKHPLRLGIGREELKGLLQIKWPHRRWQLILEQSSVKGDYLAEGNKVRVKDPKPLAPAIQSGLDCLYSKLDAGGLAPPDPNEAGEQCGINKNMLPEYLSYLVETEKVVLASGVYFSDKAFNQAKELLYQHLKRHQEVTVAEVRELWNTTRKYTIPLLEHFDQSGFTYREGDKRKLNLSKC